MDKLGLQFWDSVGIKHAKPLDKHQITIESQERDKL
jgi:hypothetical protein